MVVQIDKHADEFMKQSTSQNTGRQAAQPRDRRGTGHGTTRVSGLGARSLALRIGLCGALFLLTCVVFWPAASHGRSEYDDPVYLDASGRARAAAPADSGAFEGWHPLSWATLRWDDRIFNSGAAGHHIGNILLHASSGVLVFLFLSQMTGATWRPAMVAALFAVHPLRVEPVAWIAERKEVQAGCLGFLTLWLYANYCRAENGAARWSFYGATLAAYGLAVFSKPTVVTLPCVMLLLDAWPMNRIRWPERFVRRDSEAISAATDRPSFLKHSPSRILAEKAPLLLLAAVAALRTYQFQLTGGALSMSQHLSMGQRLANAAVSYTRYLERMAWFSKLAIPYPIVAWPAWSVAGATAAIVIVTLLCVMQRRARPWLLVGWLWFLGVLVPMSGVIQAGSQSMADRYMYIPSVGLLVMVIWLIPTVASTNARLIATAIALATTAVLTYFTRVQLRYWTDDVALFNHALDVSPQCASAHSVLGDVYRFRGQWPLAERESRAALAGDPGDFYAMENLAYVLCREERFQEAIAAGALAVVINPRVHSTHLAYAGALDLAGDSARAVEELKAAESRDPGDAFCHLRLGMLLNQLGQVRQGQREIATAISLDPSYANLEVAESPSPSRNAQPAASDTHPPVALDKTQQAHECIARGLASSNRGDHAGAIDPFSQAIAINPSSTEALIDRGLEYAALGKLDAAQDDYEQALRVDPDHPDAHLNLGGLLLMKGANEQSAAHSRRALSLRPDSGDAAYNLAMAELALGQTDSAQAHLKLALGLQPHDAQARRALDDLLQRQSAH